MQQKKEVIKSISYNQDQILEWILQLYSPAGVDLDPTYGYGNFYKKISGPEFMFDLDPKFDYVKKADAQNLPIDSGSIKTIMFDPPFAVSWNKKSYDYVMKEKYKGFKGAEELKEMYSNSIKEFYRILKRYGVLIFKCQDFVYGRRQYIIHNWIINEAASFGFRCEDLFVLLSKNRFNSFKNQNHARKYHSYFLIFRKVKNISPLIKE